MQPQSNPYEFMNSAQPASPGLLSKFTGGGNSMQKRIIVVVVVAVVLIILIAIASSIISGIGKGNIVSLSSVALDQSELTSISTTAGSSASNQLVKNLAATTLSSMTSSQAQFLKTVSKTGNSLTAKQTTANNPTITSQLTAATSSGTFDSVYVQVVQSELTTYNNDLHTAYKDTPSPTMKTLLNNLFHQSQLLQSEANAAAQNISSS